MRFSLLALVALTACDRDGRQYIAFEDADVPGVTHLGELEIMSVNDFVDNDTRKEKTLYTELGSAGPGKFGGATVTFTATGETVCIMVDPESVFWNQSVSKEGPDSRYTWPDNYRDDGDIDIDVGLTAYYTGSPGYEMGDFAAIYEDSLGNETRLEFNECYMPGYSSTTDAHAGRASLEYCDIDTTLHPQKSYTIVLNTFSLPLDDSVLSFGVLAVEGECRDAGTAAGLAEAGINECLIKGESREYDEDSDTWVEREDFQGLEEAFCTGNMAEYCNVHPQMCGDL